MADERESRSLAAKSLAQTLIVMPNNSAKIWQWKAGEEKDGKGFYWSTKQNVQQSWEQHNLIEEPQNYRTFRSTIHVLMIPIICIELGITRAAFDVIRDADLIDRLDAKLKPTGPIDYLLKLRQIKFSTDTTGDTLLHRYRKFAEPFLQLVTEAADAGCAVADESVKLAFKAACRGNDLLMTFLQEGRWKGVDDAHQRIMELLRRFDTLQNMNQLNVNPSGTQAPQPAVQPNVPASAPHQQPNIPPPPPGMALAPPVPQRQHHNPPRQQQQAVMVNAMNQLLNRFEHLERMQASNVAPAANHHQTAQINLGQAAPIPSAAPVTRPQKVHDLTPHPGVDSRGQYWHPSGQQFGCNYTPCTALFCQGCGRHGHTSAECIRKSTPGWNASGYFADRYPTQGALFSPGAPQRVAALAAAPPQPFPTPYRTKAVSDETAPSLPAQPQRYTPVVRNNMANQTMPMTPPEGGEPKQQ